MAASTQTSSVQMRIAPETAKKVRIFAAIDDSEPSNVIAEAIDLLVRERLGDKGAAQLKEITALADHS